MWRPVSHILRFSAAAFCPVIAAGTDTIYLIAVFIFVSSFLFSLVWVPASCVSGSKVLNLQETVNDAVLQK